MAEAAEEQRLLRVQKNYIELEMRKFKRKKMCSLHDLENQLLRDVCLIIVNFYLILLLHSTQFFFALSGVEQKTAAIGASSFDAAEAS